MGAASPEQQRMRQWMARRIREVRRIVRSGDCELAEERAAALIGMGGPFVLGNPWGLTQPMERAIHRVERVVQACRLRRGGR